MPKLSTYHSRNEVACHRAIIGQQSTWSATPGTKLNDELSGPHRSCGRHQFDVHQDIPQKATFLGCDLKLETDMPASGNHWGRVLQRPPGGWRYQNIAGAVTSKATLIPSELGRKRKTGTVCLPRTRTRHHPYRVSVRCDGEERVSKHSGPGLPWTGGDHVITNAGNRDFVAVRIVQRDRENREENPYAATHPIQDHIAISSVDAVPVATSRHDLPQNRVAAARE